MAVNKKRVAPAGSNAVSLFTKHLKLLMIIGCVILPIISNFVLSLILSFISGDILLVDAANFLSGFITALNLVGLFFVYAVLLNSIIRFGYEKSKKLIGFCGLRIAIIYTSYLAIGTIITENLSASFTGNLITCFTNAVVDLMLLAGALFLACFLRSKYLDEKNTNITVKTFFAAKNPLISISTWVVVLISAFLLSGCVIDTIVDVVSYGASDLNSTEIIYLITPYVSWLIKTVAGYCVMWFTAKWLDTRWRQFSLESKK
ncbi:MAG: hypothetical protein IKU48_04890 [Clostridia bacterium]|nr:hypothetical protein [Clostridia bacterium]